MISSRLNQARVFARVRGLPTLPFGPASGIADPVADGGLQFTDFRAGVVQGKYKYVVASGVPRYCSRLLDDPVTRIHV